MGDYSSEETSFALNQLDLKLKLYLNFTSGFFIEAGANNGIAQSNTLFFEKYRKWKGLLIEPIPELAEQCRINRPDCIVENCALVPFDYDKPDVEMYYCNLMSLVKGAQKSEADDLIHVEKGRAVQGIESYELRVPARTLTSILDQHQIETIDFLSLDVEGFELNVLQGLDFNRYKPTFLLVEARFREEIDAFLSPFYEPIAELSCHDVLYKSKQSIAEEINFKLSTPVAFFIFNRPDLTKRVFQAIAQVKPEVLFVIADGPRSEYEAMLCEQTRQIIDDVDWDCRVLTNFSDRNLGCKERVVSGLSWIFSQVEEVIILEDDCLPTRSFFRFCQTLLEYYRSDTRVFAISGNNFQCGQRRTDYSYYFSRYFHCWGWASWRRVWQQFDRHMMTWSEFSNANWMQIVFDNPFEQAYWSEQFAQTYIGEINSWAYIWLYTCLSQSGLTIIPEENLVSNIGFRQDATHTGDSENPLANLPTSDLWQLQHPPFVISHREADAFTFKYAFGGQQMQDDILHQLQESLASAQAQQQQLQAELEHRHKQQQQLQTQLVQTQNQYQQAQNQLCRQQVLLEQYQSQHQQLQSQLEQCQFELLQLHTQLAQTRVRCQRLQSRLQQLRYRSHRRQQNLRAKLAQTEATLQSMQSSKFWKLRTHWFQFRRFLGLGGEP
ncbi:MAG: FkbM family methyltransferase [Synechococcales cyanobacterium C42_A2020_086]|nr:FkbM family methyltransferase [Synechococcales cyanobacterium C42_A2020_086]